MRYEEQRLRTINNIATHERLVDRPCDVPTLKLKIITTLQVWLLSWLLRHEARPRTLLPSPASFPGEEKTE